jgi:Lar family restriction alleviation protein
MGRPKLLPCPFCGEKPSMKNSSRLGSWYHDKKGKLTEFVQRIECKCGIKSHNLPDKSELIKFWNTRKC